MRKFLATLNQFEVSFTGGVAIAVLLVLVYVFIAGCIELLTHIVHLLKYIFGRK